MDVPSLLDWLPGETLYSLCARQHAFWGHSHPSRTAQILFGGRQAGFQHDFPGCIAALAERTKGVWGSGRLIAENRTLLRFFRPFLDEARYENAINAMLSRSVAHLKFSLGLLTSHFRANHPLKACPECIEADRGQTGWTQWHLEHQFPGIWVCRRHETILFESTLKATGVSRFDWVRPLPSGEWQPCIRPSAQGLSRLKRLAELIAAVVNEDRPAGWLPIERIQGALIEALRARGMVTESGQLRLKMIAPEFVEYAQGFQGVRELEALPVDQADAEMQLGRLLRPMRTGTHPLRFLVLIDWLFPNFDAFQQALRAIDNVPESADRTPAGPKPDEKELLRRVVVDRIRSGEAPSPVARSVGIDVATARAWAAAQGIITSSRPSVLLDKCRAAVVRDLERGLETRAVAEKHSLSLSSITRVLRTTVGLHERWRIARATGARDVRRAEWLQARKKLPGHGPKLLRASFPAVYAWLYRNDRAWLEVNSLVPVQRPSTQSRIRWDERDLELRAAVQNAVLRLSEERSGRSLRLWQIYQAVPELKAKLLQLDRMPLTSATLEQALKKGRRPRNN
ncbi:hypothetical protein B1810_14445 [Panacagrimonas perspica]|nr:hypothetical protein B1810_14445 [Panacagrimonas perspica]